MKARMKLIKANSEAVVVLGSVERELTHHIRETEQRKAQVELMKVSTEAGGWSGSRRTSETKWMRGYKLKKKLTVHLYAM